MDPVPITRSLMGSRYIIVYINSAGQFEEGDDDNNVLISEDQVNIPNINPALVPIALEVNEEKLYAGRDVTIQWTVQNTGTGTLFAQRSMIVNVFISKKAEIDFSSSVIAQNIIKNDISVQETHNMSVTAVVPEKFAGNYYIVIALPVETNPHVTDESQLTMRTLITVHIPPSPDFVPNIDKISQVDSNGLLSVTWTVVNIGNSMLSLQSWCDRVILSFTAGVISGSEAYSLGEECFDMKLQYQQRYTVTKPFLVNYIPPGKYVPHVITDSGESLSERNGEANNVASYDDVVELADASVANLRLSDVDFQVANQVVGGDDITVSYSVRNTGQYSTQRQSWINALYAYPERLQSTSDILKSGFFMNQVLK